MFYRFFRWLFPNQFRKIESDASDKAIARLVELLSNKEAIYVNGKFSRLVLNGDNQAFVGCTFDGTNAEGDEPLVQINA